MPMLSRIASSLYHVGRDVERAANVARILEVNHKMNLGAGAADAAAWLPIFEAFGLEASPPGEAGLYEGLVLSLDHPFSVRACVARARERGRAMRDLISEEMWLHLNRHHLALAELDFDAICRRGRTAFNDEVAGFCDGFHGIAHSTMVRGPGWHFLRMGKYVERARMLCRITRLKVSWLDGMPHEEGSPVDFHHWQAVLRSVSGYEPYRRTYDVRIRPERVLELLLQSPDFPRSLRFCLDRVTESLARAAAREVPADVAHPVQALRDEIHFLEPRTLLREGTLGVALAHWETACDALETGLDRTFFRTTMLPASSGESATFMQVAQQ